MSKVTKPFVEAALELADGERSKLGERERELYGRSSTRLRAFINNVCSKDNTNYLEIGTDRGATLISAAYGNGTCNATGIDNFMYDEKEWQKTPNEGHIWDNMKSQLYDNIGRYAKLYNGMDVGNITVVENSFQDVDWDDMPKSDICFFDVKPLSEEVYDAFFEKVLPSLTSTAVIIFSNYSNPLHAGQLKAAFEKHEDKVKVLWEEQRVSGGLSDATQYFSGIGIFGVVKQAKAPAKTKKESALEAAANAVSVVKEADKITTQESSK